MKFLENGFSERKDNVNKDFASVSDNRRRLEKRLKLVISRRKGKQKRDD